MSCVERSPGVAGEGKASQGVSSWPRKGKCRPRVKESKRPSSSTPFGSTSQGVSLNNQRGILSMVSLSEADTID